MDGLTATRFHSVIISRETVSTLKILPKNRRGRNGEKYEYE